MMIDKHKRESLLLRDLLKKLIIIVIGSIVAAYGITLALYAGFGGATLAVLWQGIAETFHLSIGMASFVVAVGMILFALIYDKSQIHIGTVLYQIVYSTCVDVFATCHVYSTYRWFNFFIIAKKGSKTTRRTVVRYVHQRYNRKPPASSFEGARGLGREYYEGKKIRL